LVVGSLFRFFLPLNMDLIVAPHLRSKHRI
jgi:hypothetical protein